MSQQYTLEIEKFNHGQNLIINVRSALFTQFPQLPVETVGATKKTAEAAKEIIVYRSLDQYSPVFTIQTGQSFPKVVLRVNSLDGGKNYLFTFHKAVLEYQIPFVEGNKPLEEIQFVFDEFSMTEISPVGNTGNSINKRRTSDRLFEAAMNFVKG